MPILFSLHSLIERDSYHNIELVSDEVFSIVTTGVRFSDTPAPEYRSRYNALTERALDACLEVAQSMCC